MKRYPHGFTLVELLVVIAIIGVLVAMAIPAMQASRETSRRAFCQHNAGRLLLALQSYEDAFESLPPGVVNPDGPIRNEAVGLERGWLVEMLPYLDEQSAYMQIDRSKSVYDPANERVRRYWPRIFVCPSESLDINGASNYAGCHHDVEAPIDDNNNGVLFRNSAIRREDITDGVAHTFFVGEKRAEPGDLGWMSGTRATLRNTGTPPNDPASDPGSSQFKPPKHTKDDAEAEAALLYVGGFASQHSGGLQMGFGDGSVQFLSDSIDQTLWRRLANRADGSLVNSPAGE